jgi:hypothetical protein
MECERIRPGRLLCAIALAIGIYSSGRAAEEPCVLVLRSGGVLHGQVSVSGERYVVTRDNSVVDVPAPQVLLVATSLEQAYQQQRQQLTHDTPEAHLALAAWCVRYDLVEPARQELADARRLDPRDPRTAILERRLAVVSSPKSKPKNQVALQSRDENHSKLELRELETQMRELPPGVVERFTRKVQPILVNSCTASGCHQSGCEQDFQLDRAVLHGLANRRITLRNLVATLSLVDLDSPQDSDLLSIPRLPHGGMVRPIYGTRQEEQLRQLYDWVEMVTETTIARKRVVELPKKRARSTETAPLAAIEPFGDADTAAPSTFLDPAVEPASLDDVTAKPLRPKAPLKFGLDLRPWQPKDEFDAEIFNRLKDNSAEQGEAASMSPPASR